MEFRLRNVFLVDSNHITCEVNGKKIKRTIRKHTKEIRAMIKEGVYCFEIQGILYWYSIHPEYNHVYPVKLIKFKEPEEFRNSSRKTNNIVTRRGSNYIEAEIKNPVIKPLRASQEVVKKEPDKESEEIRHGQYETIKACIQNNIPVYLSGPAGSGKNYTLEQISWDLGLEFYFTNSVQQEYKLTGFIDANGTYHETEFYKAFKHGGIFFLDEMDASIPEVLILLNAAIANQYFEFPNGKIYAHENFRVVAAGNTVGTGADDMYTGRMVLDMATLDRFVVIPFDYDERVEKGLAEGNEELVTFVHELRDTAEKNGIRCVFSYRCLINVTRLEKAGLPLSQILSIAVFKGLELDTVRTFSLSGKSKYHNALMELKSYKNNGGGL